MRLDHEGNEGTKDMRSSKVYVSGHGYGTGHWSATPGSQRTLCGKRSQGLHGSPETARMCRTCARMMERLVEADHELALGMNEQFEQQRAEEGYEREVLGIPSEPTRWTMEAQPECEHEHHTVRCADCDNAMDKLHAEALKMNEQFDADRALFPELRAEDETAPRRVHILPGSSVHPNNVYTITEKGHTSGDGLFWSFDHKPSIPCVTDGLHDWRVCWDALESGVDWRRTLLTIGDTTYEVCGTDGDGVWLRHSCEHTACVPFYLGCAYLIQRAYAVCEHGNRNNELCEGCGEIDEHGDQIILDELLDQQAQRGMKILGPITGRLPKLSLQIHTAGELHPAPEIGRVTFTFNLSGLLADPARKLPAELVKLDGLNPSVQDFVFETEGASDLYWDMVSLIERQFERGKPVTVLILCRGGRHRSVAFADKLAQLKGVTAIHHHKHLPVVTR